jgi:transcriptional regulator with XRE-family HTH domain
MTISISAQRISGAQIRDGRKLLGWTQQKLAEMADVSLLTVKNIEGGRAERSPSIDKAAQVLRSRGIEFVPGQAIATADMRPAPVRRKAVPELSRRQRRELEIQRELALSTISAHRVNSFSR